MIVCHITTVHPRYDNRILNKECCTLASRYDVRLIVADGKGNEDYSAVKIIDSGKPLNRFSRILFKTIKAFSVARSQSADVYHIHDPELLPMALLYRVMGKTVIYDIHEDYTTSVMIKEYVPVLLRKVIALPLALLEKVSYKALRTIIAERYYSRRFPKSTAILNYPVTEQLQPVNALNLEAGVLIYTGNVTIERGAMNILALSKASEKFRYRLVGRCSESQAEMLGHGDSSSLELIGVGRYVPFPEIIECYRKGAIAGLALFPHSPHYVDKELTKFFEYMAVGLPIIASDFPVWRELIEGNGIGFCVDPETPEKVIEKIQWLQDNPEKAVAMGLRGKQLARDVYNWDKEANKLLDFYATLG